MQGPNPIEHLKIARRLHFQGQTDEAIREYELVLELDPENEDAAAGLRSLGVEPPDPERFKNAEASAVKTNFFVNQAKESEIPAWRGGPMKVVICVLGVLMAYGLYTFAMTLINFDNIKAMEPSRLDIQFIKPTIKDDAAKVDVKVSNFNPGPVNKLVISYSILDKGGNSLKDGKVTIGTVIPAGDARTFAGIELGTVKGTPHHFTAKPESLVYKKPKLKDKLVDDFIDASIKPDKEAFADYCDIVDNSDNFAPGYVGLGRSYAARGDFKRAIENYKKALEIDSDNQNAHYYLAVALYYKGEKGDREAAKKEMDLAAGLAPDDPEISWNAKYLFSMKDGKDKVKEQEKSKPGGKATDKEASAN